MARWRAWVAAKVGQTPQGGQAGQAAGGQVIRFPVERRR